MSQTNQLVSKAVEMQQNTLENSQQALEQAIEIPMEQSVEFQRNAAQLFLNGLEMGNWLQNRSVELTRDAFSTYIDTVQSAALNTTRMAEQGTQQAESLSQQGLASQKQQSRSADGSQAPRQRSEQTGQQFQQPQQSQRPTGQWQQRPQRGIGEWRQQPQQSTEQWQQPRQPTGQWQQPQQSTGQRQRPQAMSQAQQSPQSQYTTGGAGQYTSEGTYGQQPQQETRPQGQASTQIVDPRTRTQQGSMTQQSGQQSQIPDRRQVSGVAGGVSEGEQQTSERPPE